jgi:HlyD family secretion protein
MIWKKCAVLVVASLVFLSTSIGCNKGKTETENKGEGQTAVPVEVITVERRDVISYVAATGTICPKLESKVGPRISGRIEKVYADEGDEVKEGEVLIKLEQEELKIAKNQAEAALKVAQASLNKVLAGTREEEIQQAEAGLAQAKANLEDAEVNFLRLKKLFETHTVAKKTFDNAETLYKVAQAAPLRRISRSLERRQDRQRLSCKWRNRNLRIPLPLPHFPV